MCFLEISDLFCIFAFNMFFLWKKNMIIMKKWMLPVLMLALFSRVLAEKVELLPLDATYEMTEMGYLDAPVQTAAGLILTDNRQSTICLLEDGQLRTLVSRPGCGRYTSLNADRTKLGFKSIDADGRQAPAVLDLLSEKVVLLADYADQCGQVSFSNDGTVAFTVGNELFVVGEGGTKRIPLDFYTNIVRLSPDGGMIAYSDADGHPMLMDLTSRQVRRLSSEGDLYNPRWSADSRRLVFEQGNMTLFAYDAQSGAEYRLGRGFGAHWLNADELVYSRPEYVDGDIFYCQGISVCRANADGSRLSVILPASQECPQEVGVMDDGRIAVPYSYGNRRLVLLNPSKPSEQELLYTIPADRQLAFASLPEEYSVRRALASNTIGGPVNWEEIPYINQKNDVPAYGSTGYAYGPCACAPSTSCMLLGFYGLLDRHPLNSRGSYYGSTDYAWYVGQVYTHPVTGFTFNLTHMSSCGGEAAGGYGFMWNNGSPSSKMGMFYTNNNCPGSSYDYSGLTAIRSECNGGFPFSWCITSTRSNGHLILPFRADAEYVKVNGEYVYQSLYGSVVVHDPYGNANNSTWGGSDGRHVTYDCSGFNNGHIAMVNAWGVKVHIARTPSTVEYELNGGHFTTDSVTTVFYSDLSLPVPEKEGATFLGWFADQTYSGTRLTVLAPGSGITTLYALWSDMPLVRYYLNGGSVPDGREPQPASNTALYKRFFKAYNAYYETSALTADDMSSIGQKTATVGMKNLMTADSSAWKWLGDYISSVCRTAGTSLSSEFQWSFAVECFFCGTAHTSSPVIPTFATAGQPAAWKQAWDDASPVGPITLPSVIEYSYTLPTPTKKGFDFTGWFWITDMLGDPITVLEVGDEGQLYATWTKSVGLDNLQAGISYSDCTVLNPDGLPLSVYSSTGQLLTTGNADISLRPYPAGIYIIRTATSYLKVIR